MGFITGILRTLLRLTNWSLSRIIVFMIQKWIIVATLLLLNKGSYSAKKTWALTKGTPTALKNLIREKSNYYKIQKKRKRLAKLEKKLSRSEESVEILA